MLAGGVVALLVLSLVPGWIAGFFGLVVLAGDVLATQKWSALACQVVAADPAVGKRSSM